jgi:hypothetical protein
MSVYCIGDQYGSRRWYHDDKLHRNNNLPAVEFGDGSKTWYQNGLIHRGGDLPAQELISGCKMWYRNGLKHRDGDQPAEEHPTGGKLWYQDGLVHRAGIMPAVICSNGRLYYYKYDRCYSLHRLTTSYHRLTRFGRFCLRKIRLNRLKHKRWIHGELLCRPSKLKKL